MAKPKAFINSDSTVVQQGIDGIVWATPNVARLDGYPDHKVMLRKSWDKQRVAIVSGGGSGHEPLHGGFIGPGMLTAAVSGEVFASPSVNAVLAAIRAVTGPKGCLVVIKNYTGDRLNFSIAAQMARDLFGLKVETVFVNEDVATDAKRGIAGTIFVHKIAGALAEEGASLEEVTAQAQAVIGAMASLGVSFSTCGRRSPERMGADEMEVGLGIHGEAGASREPLRPCGEIVKLVVGKLREVPALRSAKALATLVNNLGTVPLVEMGVVTAELMALLHHDVKLLVGPAPLCTALDMNGFSITLLALSGRMQQLLLAPTGAPAWPGAAAPEPPVLVQMPFEPRDVSYLARATPSHDPSAAAALGNACEALLSAKQELDGIDAIVGDGDCGSTLATGAKKVMELRAQLPMADPEALCRSLSDALGATMGGSSGALLRIMFLGMAEAFKRSPGTWAAVGGAALAGGLEAMMQAGGAKEGFRTMLDALLPAARALQQGGGLQDAAKAAAAGADATKTMEARAGRSENVPEAVLWNTPDPGAVAAAKVFAALTEGASHAGAPGTAVPRVLQASPTAASEAVTSFDGYKGHSGAASLGGPRCLMVSPTAAPADVSFTHGAVYNPEGCKCNPRVPGKGTPKVLVAPPHYIQGPGIMSALGRYTSKLIKNCDNVGLLIIPYGQTEWGPMITKDFSAHGISLSSEVFGGVPSYEEVDRLVALWKPLGIKAVVAIGGGTCGDCAKLVSFRLSVPLVNVSTLAATDAPCSALSIMYTAEGGYKGGEVYPQSPNVVVVDTDVIAKAGKRPLVSGFGDAMSTYYEARTCYENPKALSMLEARPTETALAIGALCAEMLYDNGLRALKAVESKVPDESLERVVEANTLLSGIGFESGGLAASHAIAQALSWVHSVHDNLMHGEMVAIGLLTMLTMEGLKGLPGRREEYRKVVEFFCKVGLPVCLEHAFFDSKDTASIDTFAKVCLEDQWFCHNEPFPVNKELLLESLWAADKAGQEANQEFGDLAYRSIHVKSARL